jgi:thioredoxin reductase
VVPGPVARLCITGDALTGVLLEDGSTIPCQAAFVGPRVRARSAVLSGIGIGTATHPEGQFEHVESHEAGETAVPGIWVAGNVTDITAMVVTAMADGSRAAIAVNTDLMLADAHAAVAAAGQ